MDNKISKTETEWRGLLTDEQFKILRKKGTERAFTGDYWDNHEKGAYLCAGAVGGGVVGGGLSGRPYGSLCRTIFFEIAGESQPPVLRSDIKPHGVAAEPLA